MAGERETERESKCGCEREREREGEKAEFCSLQRLAQKALDVPCTAPALDALFPNFLTMTIHTDVENIRGHIHVENIRKRSRMERSATHERNAEW